MAGVSLSGTKIVKAWITPNGKVHNVGSCHSNWMLQHGKKYGIDLKGLDMPDDDDEIRIRGLRAGFTRINYLPNSGNLVVEAHEKHFNRKAKDAVWMLVADNAEAVDNIDVVVMDDDRRPVRRGSAQLFRYSDREKLEHLPLISESLRRWVGSRAEVSERVRRYFNAIFVRENKA